MYDLHDHLLPAEKSISNEFARAQSHRLLPVGHGCGSQKDRMKMTARIFGADEDTKRETKAFR